MTTPNDLERRLRDYAQILDRAADAHDPSLVTMVELSPAAAPRRGPRVRLIAGLALGASLVGMVVFVASRSDDRKVTLLPGVPPSSAAPVVSTSPAPPASSLAKGTWRTLPPSPLSPRAAAVVVWTGQEYIVWGGRDGTAILQDGAAYDPTTNSWRSISPNQSADQGSTVVWTGSQMVVLADRSGAAYDPATDTWAALPSLSARWLGQGFTSAAYSDGVIAGFGATLNSDRTSTLFAATLRIGDTEWTEHAPRQQAGWWPGLQRAVGLNDGTVIVRLDPTTTLRFDPPIGAWSPLPDVAAPDGWEVHSTVFTSLNGKLAAIVGLRRSGTPMPTTPPTTVAPAPSNVVRVVGDATLPEDLAMSLATFEDGTARLSPPVIGLAGGLFSEAIVGGKLTYLHARSSDEFAVIDPSSATISALPLPPGRHGLEPAATVGGNQLFVWGGDLGESAVPEGDTNVSGDGSLWIPAGDQQPTPAPAATTTSSVPPALPTTAPVVIADESRVLEIDIAPWAFDLEGIDACEPGFCPSLATMADGTLVVYRYARNELTIGDPGRVVPIAEPLAAGRTWLVAIGPDDLAYLSTQPSSESDPVGDLIAVSLSGDTAGEIVARRDGVVGLSGDSDLVATPGGLVGVGCCGGNERPSPQDLLLMPWVDRTGAPITSELPWVAVRGPSNTSELNDEWAVILMDGGERQRWPIPRSVNGFRGMPLSAVRSDGSVALAWSDPIEGTQRLSVFKPDGTIEEIAVGTERSIVLLDGLGAITFDGSRFQRWSLPTFSEPVDALDTLTRELGRPELTATSPGALVAEIVDALRQPDGCELPPSARVVDDASDGTATIEYRYGCDDSGAGMNFELLLTEQGSGTWIIESATQRGLCWRGASGEFCV